MRRAVASGSEPLKVRHIVAHPRLLRSFSAFPTPRSPTDQLTNSYSDCPLHAQFRATIRTTTHNTPQRSICHGVTGTGGRSIDAVTCVSPVFYAAYYWAELTMAMPIDGICVAIGSVSQ